MLISNLHVLIALLLAFATAAALVVTAPSLTAARNRLEAVLSAVCRTIIITGWITAAIMLAWGVNTRDEQLMYFSVMPAVVAILASNVLRRNGIR
jgi:hypothetical protein